MDLDFSKLLGRHSEWEISRDVWKDGFVIKHTHCPKCESTLSYYKKLDSLGRLIYKEQCDDCGYWIQLGKQEKIDRRRLRTTDKNWRMTVILNAGSECRICGSSDDLCAHHIIPWGVSRDHRLQISNGLCLCRKCHTLVHSGRKRKESGEE